MKVLSNVPQDFWDSVVAKSDHATFFHTHAWARIITSTFPRCSNETKGFVMEDGTRVVLPLISTSVRRVFRKYVSMKPGVYGGPVTDGRPLHQEEIDAILRTVISPRTAQISITGNPLHSFALPEGYKVKCDFTQILPLAGGYQELWDHFEYNCQKQIKKGRRSGLQWRVADTLEEYEQYYSVYEQALERWGKPGQGHPFELFQAFFAHRTSNICLWVVCDESEVVGGTVVLYCNQHSVEWHAAFLSDYFQHGIRNYLIDVIVRDACAQGYQYYDFNPSGGYEGVVRFKDTFNPERREIRRSIYTSKVYHYWERTADRIRNY